MLGRVMRRRHTVVARRLPVLLIRDFRILLIDRVLAPASITFSVVGVSFAVLDKTHGSTADLSYVLAAQIAPSLIFALVGGVIADRIAPQFVIIGGNVQGETATLATSLLTSLSAGEYADGIAAGLILTGLILILGAGLTYAQQREPRTRSVRALTVGRR